MVVFPKLEDTIMKHIGVLLGITIVPAQMVLSNARVYSGTTIDRNSSIDYVYNELSGTVHYNRLDLSVLGNMPRPSWVHLVPRGNVHSMLSELSKYMGFVLLQSDFEDSVITLDGDRYTATLKATVDSPRFIGEMDVVFKDIPGIEGSLFISHTGGYI